MGIPNSNYVSSMKPLSSGGVLVAPYDPDDLSYLPPRDTAPTGTVQIDSRFVPLGYMAQDSNVSNAEETNSSDMNAWGGDLVLNVITTRKETYAFKAIEQNVEAWKLRYGDNNVIGDNENAVVIHDGASFDELHSIIVAEQMSDGRVHLGVIPKAKLGGADNVDHADDTGLGYGMTFTALAFSGSQTSYDVYYTPEDVDTTTA